MHKIRCLLLALLIITFVPSGSAAVFGRDDRRPLTPDEAAYPVREALGKLICRHPDTGSKLIGTAAIVDTGTADEGHEVLLTAAHVVMDPNTGKALENCRFKVEGRLWGSDPVIGIRTGQFNGHPQTNPEDWAMVIIKVDQPAQRRLPMWPHPTEATTVALVGYRGDRRGLWVSDNCFARAPQSGEALHKMRVWLSDCDASPGTSGAPLLAWTHGAWHWAGVYRGHLYDPSKHEQLPNQQPAFSGLDAMNVIVLWPKPTQR